ncbi:hypothetical protein LZ30DRAFT_731596 [Colletotrichum cereale]|nr:hypothetical protein LZ30DRAFT_731596 [Colletotrichum cereale]
MRELGAGSFPLGICIFLRPESASSVPSARLRQVVVGTDTQIPQVLYVRTAYLRCSVQHPRIHFPSLPLPKVCPTEHNQPRPKRDTKATKQQSRRTRLASYSFPFLTRLSLQRSSRGNCDSHSKSLLFA